MRKCLREYKHRTARTLDEWHRFTSREKEIFSLIRPTSLLFKGKKGGGPSDESWFYFFKIYAKIYLKNIYKRISICYASTMQKNTNCHG